MSLQWIKPSLMQFLQLAQVKRTVVNYLIDIFSVCSFVNDHFNIMGGSYEISRIIIIEHRLKRYIVL